MKFVLDRMLGNLASWLRMLNYDTVYLRDADDEELIRFADSEGRILLTRDKRLADEAMNMGVRCCHLESTSTVDLLRELRRKLGISLEICVERCSLCNAPIRIAGEKDEDYLLSRDYVPKELVGKEEFWICTNCGQVFWEGSHWKRIREQIERAKNDRT